MEIDIAIIGGLVIFIIAGVFWAKEIISNTLGKDFVTKEEHLTKENEINKNFKEQLEQKYHELHAQIEQNRRESEHEFKHLKDEYDKNKQMLVQIDTKVTLLLNNKIKRD